MKYLTAAALLAASATALAAPGAGVERREPVFSILPADGFESVVEGGFERLWEGVKGGWAKVEQLWSTHEDAVQVQDGGGFKEKTVYQILAEDEQFSKFFFLITQDPSTVTYLSTYSGPFTLFAPTNAAFPTPSPHQLPLEFGNPLALETLHRYFTAHPQGSGWAHKAAVKIVHALVQYHVLPHEAYALAQLAENSTAGTALHVPGSLLGAAQRIKLTPGLRPFPTIQINFAGHIVAPDKKASNGIVHGVNRALQPGLSAMEQLYGVPWLFPFAHSEAPWFLEVTAGALARTGLDKVVSHKPVFHRPSASAFDFATEEEQSIALAAAFLTQDEDLSLPGLSWTGSPALTIFAPSNKAWSRLPPRLSQWLHSPWGEWALEKLLKFHIVNGTVLFADWVHPKLSGVSPSAREGEEGEGEGGEALWPKYDYTALLPTLLGANHTLPIHVNKRPVLRLPPPGGEREVAAYHMWAKGVPVAVLDVPARNGAVQVVEWVLNPLGGRNGTSGHGLEEGKGEQEQEGEGEWDRWEDWFVKWAREA
ncbi:FAS1 domain-containing protein [Calocera cornea HHB12733]|uniref:FAS1 domain-containing protein n=1 Tax=Calocera cornea HHB12733 TaxID=1353952 RepID=A0A165HLM9_9BASI|nr:FAS1 domain-containing protein [Calocera cornea HHB12733]